MEIKCKLSDLVVNGLAEQRYTLDEDFDPDQLIEDTGIERIESYECGNCGRSFYSAEDTKQHLEENK